MSKTDPQVDAYVATFPPETRAMLEQLRALIMEAAPEATEGISYQMPAYKMKKVLVYFAGYKNHIGFYPTASGIEAFKDEISGFKNSKGAVQFPLDQPLPEDLIRRMVRFKVAELKKKP